MDLDFVPLPKLILVGSNLDSEDYHFLGCFTA